MLRCGLVNADEKTEVGFPPGISSYREVRDCVDIRTRGVG